MTISFGTTRIQEGVALRGSRLLTQDEIKITSTKQMEIVHTLLFVDSTCVLALKRLLNHVMNLVLAGLLHQLRF